MTKKSDKIAFSRRELEEVLKTVKSQELKDFINSLLKEHGM